MNRPVFHAAIGLLPLSLACATATPTPPPPAAAEPQPAPPVDPPTVTDGDVTVGWVNGMQIIVKRLPNAELVAGSLYIKGGVRNWGKDDAGVEQLALSVSASGGTASLDKDAFDHKLSAMGSTINAGATNDFSAWAAKSLKDHWDETFALLVDAFLHPALPANEIEVQRSRQISGLKHELENPDAHLGLLVHETLFKNHPYANRAVGTIESVKALTRDALVRHLAQLRQTSRLLLVVAGDVDAEHVIAQARAALGSLPRGDYAETPLPPVRFDKASVAIQAQPDLPTNYIQGTFFGPGWRDADFPAAIATAQVLSWREFEEVRTKRNLSYAASAFYSGATGIPRGGLYVTATNPEATIKVMFDEVRKVQGAAVPEKELTGDKSVFLTGYLMGSESTDGQVGLLARAQLYGGDWHLARTLPDKIRAVSPADVEAFAKKYIRGLQVVVLGDPAKIDKTLFESL